MQSFTFFRAFTSASLATDWLIPKLPLKRSSMSKITLLLLVCQVYTRHVYAWSNLLHLIQEKVQETRHKLLWYYESMSILSHKMKH